MRSSQNTMSISKEQTEVKEEKMVDVTDLAEKLRDMLAKASASVKQKNTEMNLSKSKSITEGTTIVLSDEYATNYINSLSSQNTMSISKEQTEVKEEKMVDVTDLAEKVRGMLANVETHVKQANTELNLNNNSPNFELDKKQCVVIDSSNHSKEIVEEIRYLETRLGEDIKSQIECLFEKIKEESFIDKTEHIENAHIREKFIYAFETAVYEIDIISPWISRWVADNNFLWLVEQALKRNVTIKILYGIEESSNNSERSDNTDKIAMALKNKFKRYNNLFRMKKVNTHYKLLICDEEFYVAGSFNYLSFSGDYSNPNTRHEGADYSANKKLIRDKRSRYFDF
jgi:molybdenum cofactor biosynthesis enzyme